MRDRTPAGSHGRVGPVAGARHLVFDRLAAGSWSRSDADLLAEVAEILALRSQVDALLLDAVGEVEARGLAAGRGSSDRSRDGVADQAEVIVTPILDKETGAHRDRTLSLTPDRDGAGGLLRARLDAVGYATLAAYLDAATAPGLTPDTPGPAEQAAAVGDSRTIGQRRHDAPSKRSARPCTPVACRPRVGSSPGSCSPFRPTPWPTGPARHGWPTAANSAPR